MKVRVVDPHGGPVSCFTMAMRRCIPEHEWKYGSVPDVPNRKVKPSDLQVDALLLDHVPPGEFVVRIDTLGFARTVSPSFKLEAGASTEVVVRMSQGGTIRGQVVDPNGKPLDNVCVATADELDAGHWSGGLRELFGSYLPGVTTTASTGTDRNGNFVLDELAFGAYVLRIHHDAFCDHLVRDIQVGPGADVMLEPVRLDRAALVEGRAVVERNPEPLWVCVFASGPAGKGWTFWSETESDATGRFRLPRRVPPGDYTIWFQRTSEKRMNDRAMYCISSLKPHEQPLRVAEGEESVTVEVPVR